MTLEENNEGSAGKDQLRIQHDWIWAKGRYVEVRHEDSPPRRGVVEDVTDDGAILWIAANGPCTRSMVLRSDGFKVWMAPQ